MIQPDNQSQPTVMNPPPSEHTVSILDLLIILARRRKFILLSALATTAIAILIALLLPNQFTAETVLMPPAQNASMGSTLISQVGGGALASLAGGSLGLKNPGDMYVSLLRSRTVQDAVIDRFRLMARYRTRTRIDARKQLEKHALITLGTKDGLIRISVRDRDPSLAATIANAYVDEFKKFSASLAITEAEQRRLFFQQQLQQARDNLTTAEIALKSTEQSTGVLQIDSQARALIESGANLRAQIAAKEVQLQGLRAFATDDNPDVVTVKRQLSALQDQMSQLAGSDHDPDSELLIPKGRIPGAGLEYIRKYRDVKYYETIFELIAKQFEIAKLDEARQGAIIQVVDVAVRPDKKSSPFRSLIVVLALLAGVLLGSFIAVMQEAFQLASGQAEYMQKLRAMRAALRFKRRS